MGEVTVDTATVDTVAKDLLMLNPGEVDTVDMEDMVDTAVDTEDMVDTDTVDTVAREKLKLNQKPLQLLMPKPGVLLDTDTVPDTVLVDMEVTVLGLPAMEVMVDTAVDMEVMVDTDVATVDMEDTVVVDMDT